MGLPDEQGKVNFHNSNISVTNIEQAANDAGKKMQDSPQDPQKPHRRMLRQALDVSRDQIPINHSSRWPSVIRPLMGIIGDNISGSSLTDLNPSPKENLNHSQIIDT
jgi:hypothetical protein